MLACMIILKFKIHKAFKIDTDSSPLQEKKRNVKKHIFRTKGNGANQQTKCFNGFFRAMAQ